MLHKSSDTPLNFIIYIKNGCIIFTKKMIQEVTPKIIKNFLKQLVGYRRKAYLSLSRI